jgi:hypothetical protein
MFEFGHKNLLEEGKRFFDSMVAGAFQIIFRVKIHANDTFLFFKNHF